MSARDPIARSSSSSPVSAAQGQEVSDDKEQRGWARRLSISSRNNFPALPALPQLPMLSQLPLGTPGLTTLQNLRSALLGYLGEVEDSVRSMGEVSDAGTVDSDVTGSSSGLDEAGGEAKGWSSGVASGTSTLRARKEAGEAKPASVASKTGSAIAPDQRTNHEALLAHLSNLRADVQAYLPLPPLPSFRVPLMPYNTPGSATASAAVAQTQEWLRSLPGRLRAVERALPGTGGPKDGSVGHGRTLGDLMSSFPFPTYAYGAETQRGDEANGGSSLGGARLRLLEIVRSALPSDEWEGWERLGWEETELHPDDRDDRDSRYGFSRANPWASGSQGTRLTRSLSHPARMQIPSALDSDEEDDDAEDRDEVTADETETGDDDDTDTDGPRRPVKAGTRVRATSNFLFPNRTPAATEAIKRRRNVRSRSLGSAGHPGRWAALLGDEWRKGEGSGQAHADERTSLLDRDEDEGEDNALVEPLVGGIAASPVKLRPPPMSRNKSSIRIGNPGELGPSVAEALEISEDGKVLITYEDLPVDWRNNEHVLTGYRFIPLHASTGPIPLIKSAFAWHNETLNIHTHFIPTVFVLCFIPFLLYSTPLPDAHPLDTIVLALYLVAAVSCMFSSAMWHVLSGCASKKWFEWGACVDYIGISWLIAASFGTVVYNAFYCRPKLVYLYLGTNAACGALGSYLPFQRWFNMRRMKPWRIAFFLFLNFAMFAPLLQLFWLHGWAAARFCVAFVPSICAYVAGLLFYGFHFPECVWPGKFDTWGASHQIWHTGIVLAIILHYCAVFSAHNMRHDLTCAVPGAGVEVGRAVEAWVKGLWS